MSVILPNTGQGFGPGGNGYCFSFLTRSRIFKAAYATTARMRLPTISVLKNMVVRLGVNCSGELEEPESLAGRLFNERVGV